MSIDTIKFGIPLSQNQHKKLHQQLLDDEHWQWVQFCSRTGELRYTRYRGLAELDQPSYQRQVLWDIPETYRDKETFLVVELSLPKFWYGHNIRLLYNFIDALRELRKIFEKGLHCRFADVIEWHLFRIDVCYSWNCPSQLTSQKLINSLKHLHYPRKKPIIYETGILFKGTTYSLKFYLKLPEFIHHDRPSLLKSEAKLEWINHLEKLADGVIRCEAILRRKYLKQKNLLTVADLIKPVTEVIWDNEFLENYSEDLSNSYKMLFYFVAITNYQFFNKSPDRKALYETIIDLCKNDQVSKGLSIYEQVKRSIKDEDKCYAPPHTGISLNGIFEFKGGGFTVQEREPLLVILNQFLNKFIGENRGMNSVDIIKEKLLEKYKPVKASRLVAFWLYVQKFGSVEAKEMFGRDSYYRSKRELKDADINLVEPPQLTIVDDEFLKNFKFDIPSPYVTNTVDDFRDSENVINLNKYKDKPNIV